MKYYLDEIEKKKITAVCFDNGMVGGELPYIGIDNHKTGYQLAQELAEQLDHKGQVGIVAGDLKQKGHRERVEGFEEYMKSEPAMPICRCRNRKYGILWDNIRKSGELWRPVLSLRWDLLMN